MHQAVCNIDIIMAELLLSHGADPKLKEKAMLPYGYASALRTAKEWKDKKMIKLLQKHSDGIFGW